MNQSVLTLTPGGQPLAQTLGFEARAVIVDNFTSSYLQLTDVGKTIPPWDYGEVVALPPGITRATASLVPTTPAVAGPPVPLSQATLTWTDQPLPAAPGQLLSQANSLAAAQSTVAAQTVLPAPPSLTLNVPAGTIYLALVLNVTVGSLSYRVAGVTTALQYLPTETLPVGGPYLRYFKLHPLDTQIVITNVGAGTLSVAIGENIDTNGAAPPSKLAPPDWQAQSSVNGSGTASANSGTPPAGQTAVVKAVTFSVAANAGRVFNGRVWDGASGGTRIGGCIIGSPGAGAGWAAATVYLKKATPGNALTFDFDFAAAAGEQHALDASGYFE